MTELILERSERLSLRSQAHHLSPVVLLGASGLTDAVLHEIDRALACHGLIKVHVPSDERAERVEIYAGVADKLGAARVQMIGKMLIFFRPVKDKEDETQSIQKNNQSMNFGTKPDRGARGLKKPAAAPAKRTPVDTEKKKRVASKKPGAKRVAPKPVIVARKKPKHLTKKAALS